MPSSAKWGLTGVAAVVISLILLGLSDGLHTPALAWASLVCIITGFVLIGVVGPRSRARKNR
jgi:hypothetical protein